MKFRAVHIRTNLGEEREERSRQDVQSLMEFGVEYCAEYSPVYKGEMPEPREAGGRPFVLTPAHYGCYKAHKDAFCNLKDGVDALLMFECDAVFTVPPVEMGLRINRAWTACMEGNLDVFTFGPKHDGKTIDRVGKDVIVITQFIETHAYMIPKKSFDYFTDLFSRPWDALDYVYTVYMYDRDKKRIGTFADRAVSVQATGISLIDERLKTEDYWRNKRYA